MPIPDTIKILLADDHKILCEGLRGLIEKERPKWKVVGEAGDGASAVDLAGKLSPDVVVMDISMPGLNGIEATRQITLLYPDMKILALSMHSDRQFILEMFGAGARGYLLKDCAVEELIAAIQAIVENRAYLSSQLASAMIKEII